MHCSLVSTFTVAPLHVQSVQHCCCAAVEPAMLGTEFNVQIGIKGDNMARQPLGCMVSYTFASTHVLLAGSCRTNS